MDEHGLRPEDVASRAEIGVRTVTRFLARECAISHLAEKALDRMAAELRLPAPALLDTERVPL